MKDYSELKRMAEDMKGWDKMTECWPSDENGPDWQVGRLDEEDNRWPLMTVDTEQYDQEQDAPKVAQYYAAANPAAVLELIAEVESMKKDAARYRWLRQYDFDIGSYHPEGDFSHESWFERFDDQSIDRMIAEEIAFEEEAIIEANNK